MISPMTQNVRPMISVRRRPSKSPMKMVAMADTIHPRCHVPTVRPTHVSQIHVYSRLRKFQRTCDPSMMEARIVDDIYLRKPIQELLNGQQTAHNTLRISKTSADCVLVYKLTTASGTANLQKAKAAGDANRTR